MPTQRHPPMDDAEAEAEAQRQAEAVTEAKRQVRFEIPDLESFYTSTGRPKHDSKHRQSLEGVTALPDEEATTATIDDDDDIAHPPEKPSLYKFRQFVCPDDDAFETCRHQSVTQDDTYEDTMHRVEAYAAKLGKSASGPKTSFVPLTPDGKEAWPQWRGTMSYTQFTEAFAKAPEALFQEFKIRSFLVQASNDTSIDLTKVLKTTDRNLRVLYHWVVALGEELEKEVAERDDIVATAIAEQLQEKDEIIAAMKDKIVSLVGGTGEGLRPPPGDPPAPPGPPSRRENTPGGTEFSEGGTRLSAKIPDPPVFTYEKPEPGKTAVTFEQWSAFMKSKLRDNADRFPNENAKINYILGRTGGIAAENLLPFLDKENGDAILNTAEEVMSHMDDNYKDYNAYEKACVAFRDLKMSTAGVFTVFRIEFVKLAGKAKIKQEEYKRELYDKLPARLNTICVDQYYDPDMKFNEFCAYINRYDHQQRKNWVQQQAKKTTNAGAGPGASSQRPTNAANRGATPSVLQRPSSAAATSSSEHFGIPVLATAKNGHAMYKRGNLDQSKRLIAAGKCFICHEHGHVSRNCPLATEFKAADVDRINAIVAAAMGNEHASSDALETAENDLA